MLDRLKCALVLAETLNFHRAAAKLGISQPHLTRIIKALEDDVGIALFERGPHAVSVTAVGSLVFKEAALLLKAETAFNTKISALRKKSSETLKVAVGAFISHSWAGAAITAVQTANPNVAISLRELDWWTLFDAIQSGEFDLAVGEMSQFPDDPELVKDLFPERTGSFVVRAEHPLASRLSVKLNDIAKFPLAAPRLPARMAHVLPKNCGMGALSDNKEFFLPMIECATPRSMIDVVSASNAVCMIWPEYCSEQLMSGLLRELPFRPPWLKTSQGIMYRRNRPLPSAALAFRNAAKSAERRYFRHRRA